MKVDVGEGEGVGSVFEKGGHNFSEIKEEKVVGINGGGGGRENEPARDFSVKGCTCVKGLCQFLSPGCECWQQVFFGCLGVVFKGWVQIEPLKVGEEGGVVEYGGEMREGVFLYCEVGRVLR